MCERLPLLQIIEALAEVDLAGGDDDMFPRLLYKHLHARVRLVQQTQTRHQARHVTWKAWNNNYCEIMKFCGGLIFAKFTHR